MKGFAIAALLAASAAAVSAAPRLCKSGLPPSLSGDLFAPIDCSTGSKPSPQLPGLSVVREGSEVKTDLKDLEGRWEGFLIHALGRYEVLLTVKTGWGGKTTLTLDMKEQQFRDRLTDRLSLVPRKERGSYDATLTSSLAPSAALEGGAVIGAAAPADHPVQKGGQPPPDRQAEVTFANGAAHRVYFAVKDKTVMRVRAYSGIPGTQLQKFEVELTKTKREAL